MKKVHDMVAHMVDSGASLEGLDPANYEKASVEELWTEFLVNRTVSILCCSHKTGAKFFVNIIIMALNERVVLFWSKRCLV